MDFTAAFDFFLVVPDGFEPEAAFELTHKFPSIALSSLLIEKGGIGLRLPLAQGLALNYWLKIPTRILLRLKMHPEKNSFIARDFPKLFNKLKKFPFESWLNTAQPKIKVTAHESKLFHSGRIEKTFMDALKKRPIKILNQTENEFEVFVRIIHNEVTISLNTGGIDLYKRGQKSLVGIAPLRENLAAALLIKLWRSMNCDTSQMTLVDPMCGSGTFLTEAQNFYLPNHGREYAFEKLAFDFKSFQIQKLHPWFHSYLGIDKNPDKIIHNQKNDPGISFVCANFEQYQLPSTLHSTLVVVNPPLGKRLSIPHPDFYLHLAEKVLLQQSVTGLGMITPLNVKLPKSENASFKNGGLACQFMMVKKENNKLK
jgi:putative N6-adenine-specific DNA methylase